MFLNMSRPQFIACRLLSVEEQLFCPLGHIAAHMLALHFNDWQQVQPKNRTGTWIAKDSSDIGNTYTQDMANALFCKEVTPMPCRGVTASE